LLTRDKARLDHAKFRDVIDQLSGNGILDTVYFFNYGEPFLHPQAEDMLIYLRKACPSTRIVTSTNGIPLAKAERARKIVDAQVDFVTFTIGGIKQGSYSNYHRNGQVGLALQGLQNVIEFKKETSRSKPFVIWRYLVFRWNDTEKEIDAAIELSELYGVDQFCLFLTHIPKNASSYRLVPGSPLFDKYRRFIEFVHAFECELPDERGFYSLEHIPGLGSVMWSCWRAVVQRRRNGHYLHLRISTNRPSSSVRDQYCFVRTTWISIRVLLKPMEWRAVSILIPWEFRGIDVFEVELLTEDYWFPIEETGSSDMRCLGVLLSVDMDFSISDRDASGLAALQGFDVVTPAEQRRLDSYGPRSSLPQLGERPWQGG
jgi:hypothetical protein